MFPRRFVLIAAVGLILLGLFVIVPNMQRDAWTQGYLVGRLSDGGTSASVAPLAPVAPAPLAPYGYAGYGYQGYGPHFSILGFLLVLGIGFFIFTRVARCMMWRAHRYWGGPQGQGPQGPHGPQGPEGFHSHGGDWGWGRHGHHHPWWGWDDEPQPGSGRPGQGGTAESPTGERGEA